MLLVTSQNCDSFEFYKEKYQEYFYCNFNSKLRTSETIYAEKWQHFLCLLLQGDVNSSALSANFASKHLRTFPSRKSPETSLVNCSRTLPQNLFRSIWKETNAILKQNNHSEIQKQILFRNNYTIKTLCFTLYELHKKHFVMQNSISFLTRMI